MRVRVPRGGPGPQDVRREAGTQGYSSTKHDFPHESTSSKIRRHTVLQYSDTQNQPRSCVISYLEASIFIDESESSTASFLPLRRRRLRVVQIAAGESKKKWRSINLRHGTFCPEDFEMRGRGAFQLICQKCQRKGRKGALVYWLAGWLEV